MATGLLSRGELRNLALWLLGAGLVVWDVTIYTPGTAEPYLLVFYAALLGLPFLLGADEWLRRKRNDS